MVRYCVRITIRFLGWYIASCYSTQLIMLTNKRVVDVVLLNDVLLYDASQ